MQIKIFELNPVQVNTYLIYDETKEAALIDCGVSSKEEREKIKEYIDLHHLKLKRLLNTHLHFDHILGNRFIYDTYGLKPEYHAAEESMPGLKMQASTFGMFINYEPVTAEHFINEGDFIRFGNTTLKALLTPGHSPGSLSFYCFEGNCVFTGDALFRHDIGRTDLWGGNEAVLIAAIRNKLLTLPDLTVIYPGHGPASNVKEEKQHNPYINYES
ncbi:MAG: MBL fold metallo-hydrolase [Dysgonamonadaceae bacterium]|jgi:glyoxylase-like metal-dependent hydrolase (beta-lactamase superfamily II)|nr:MBL fold metallo-hydrolase [Dysgonamonadaceae bacterium]